jgi:hypothetical protein
MTLFFIIPVNIHTEKNMGGEIRGQLLPQVAPVFR